MQNKTKEIVQEMQKELEAYKADNSSAKEYFKSMKEISEFLASQGKK